MRLRPSLERRLPNEKCGAFSLDHSESVADPEEHAYIAIPSWALSSTALSPMARAPYSGTSRKLVLALDIGTTFSGAAYTFLDPGEVPQIHSVTK